MGWVKKLEMKFFKWDKTVGSLVLMRSLDKSSTSCLPSVRLCFNSDVKNLASGVRPDTGALELQPETLLAVFS